MAGPRDQTQIITKVPPGEAQRIYAPGYLANKIKNYVVTEEQTLRAVRAGCKYEINEFAANKMSKNTRGLFHAGLDNGMSDMLIVRSGSKLYRHAGWMRNWELLKKGFSNDDRPSYPDQFVVINNRIIWSNGRDRAQVITATGAVLPLGFQETPSAPDALGPTKVHVGNKLRRSPNQDGYSVYGRVGTSSDAIASSSMVNLKDTTTDVVTRSDVSDNVQYAGIVDRLMASRYYYYVQYEDSFGNLSPISAKSNGVRIFNERTYPNLGVFIEDIKRQLLVKTNSQAPENTVAVHIYRTPDVKRISAKPFRLARIPGTSPVLYPDNTPDAELGPEAKEYVPVPVFKIAAAYQGRLVIANFPGEPGGLRVSEPGFPGTFESHMYAMPDTGGAEITGLYSSAGGLYAFTRTSVYHLEIRPEGILFTPISTGVGCVAPGTIKAYKDGSLIWLSTDGFVRMSANKIVSISEPISETIRNELSKARALQAQAVIDPETGEYRCIVTTTGSAYNDLMLSFGELGWRRIDLNWDMSAICTTDDSRNLTLIAATPMFKSANPTSSPAAMPRYVYDNTVQDSPVKDVASAGHDIVVFDRERYGNQDLSAKVDSPEAIYRSAWIRADEAALTPVNVRMLYIAMLDSEGKTIDVEVDDDGHGYGLDPDTSARKLHGNYTITFYKNGSWTPVSEHKIHGLGTGEDAPIRAASIPIGDTDDKVRARRLFWRKVAPDLKGVTTWAFQISAKVKNRPHLQAFAFDISTAGTGTPMGRIPDGLDL